MKAWSGLLLAILFIAPASAQVAAWSDPQGDQSITYSPADEDATTTDVPNDAGWYPYLDILRAGIYAESENDVTFEMVIADDEPQGTEPDTIWVVGYYLYFTYHDEPMRVHMYWYQEWSEQPYAYVERLEGEYWQYMTWTETKAHPDETGWTVTIPKWDLRDTQQVPAREGDTFSNIWATAGRSEWDDSDQPIPSPAGLWGGGIYFCATTEGEQPPFGEECGIRAEDTAGSADSPLGAYTLTKSPEGLGHILLETERPFRSSNGLATTYVYEMRLFNLDEEPDTVSLAATNIPSGWDVYLPPRVELEAGEIKDIRMAIGVPFGHKHGESAGLTVIAKSERDPTSTSETNLMVFWPEIAQPSGHHPRIYFHSDGYREWMNTAQVDPDADGSGLIPPTYANTCRGCVEDLDGGYAWEDAQYGWYMYLRPGLFTGLDFEIDQTIEGNIDLATRSTMDANVVTDLVLWREDMEPLTIGTQEHTISFTAGESTSIPISMPVAAAADRIPYEASSGLYFIVRLDGAVTDPQAGATAFADWTIGLKDNEDDAEIYSTGSYLDLPLRDFHDEVDPGLLDALTRLQLEAPEEIARPVNPGKTAAYFFEVLNKGDVDDTVQWSIEGPHAHWATVVPAQSKVDSQDKATVAIRVDVPEDARSDEVADLLLVGQSTKDPEAQVFGNFLAYVETGADIPDESDRFAELQDTAEDTKAKGAPFPAGLVLAGVVVAAFIRRRTQ